jgi:hypothetical protein
MNSAGVFGASLWSGTPSRRATPKTPAHNGNRQRFHSLTAETCPNKASQLCFHVTINRLWVNGQNLASLIDKRL